MKKKVNYIDLFYLIFNLFYNWNKFKANEESFKNEKSTIDPTIYKEGGWGWIVVIATGYSFGIIIGFINNYALIYNKFDNVYAETKNHIFYAGSFFKFINGQSSSFSNRLGLDF